MVRKLLEVGFLKESEMAGIVVVHDGQQFWLHSSREDTREGAEETWGGYEGRFVDFIPVDTECWPAVEAFEALLRLSIENHHGPDPSPIEGLLREIFLSGRESIKPQA